MLTLQDRADAYSKVFPKYPPLVTYKRWIYGVWIIGSIYRSSKGYYGEYPYSYLKRVKALYPDVPADKILHLFSGVVEEGITIDLNPELKPTYVADASNLPFSDNSFPLIVADPPYSKEAAAMYGYPMINRKKVLQECIRVLVPGGHIVWLDTLPPGYSKKTALLVGTIGIINSMNRCVRMVLIYEKNMPKDDPEEDMLIDPSYCYSADDRIDLV